MSGKLEASPTESVGVGVFTSDAAEVGETEREAVKRGAVTLEPAKFDSTVSSDGLKKSPNNLCLPMATFPYLLIAGKHWDKHKNKCKNHHSVHLFTRSKHLY